MSGYRDALGFPGFRRLWVAAVISRGGDAINFVALPVFAYTSTRSPGAVGLLVAVEGMALIVGGAAAHLVLDRFRPRRLLAGIDLLRALAALALAVLPSYPMAVAVAAILALGTSWFSPASAALVPRLVDRPSLPSANALIWTAGVALQLMAAPLGGLLVTVAPARIAFGLNAASFLASSMILLGLPRRAAPAGAISVWRQLPEALRVIPRIPMLGTLLLTQGIAAVAVGATSALLVVLAEQAYGMAGTGFGIWLALVGTGALLGPLMTAHTLVAPVKVMTAAYALRGAGDIALGTLSNGVAGGGLLVIYGLGTSAGTVAYQTLVQDAVPGNLRGRAFALLDVVWQSGRLTAVAIGSLTAGAVGIRPVFVVGGSLLLLAGAVGAIYIRPPRA